MEVTRPYFRAPQGVKLLVILLAIVRAVKSRFIVVTRNTTNARVVVFIIPLAPNALVPVRRQPTKRI
ncbi:predicted protein [Lichtheimia corymbifera JMRC:FSU:9682]|uniref:Uncharacterized protein n=1 Tax=Lichtheimia corymbifera JMRC:FSU:9682 TaxID=1263082 RepID=A0A068RNA3_9FUNG|nr:predicted protein [Lichtheimia corymbifera JMRC:FSU:9682]